MSGGTKKNPSTQKDAALADIIGLMRCEDCGSLAGLKVICNTEERVEARCHRGHRQVIGGAVADVLTERRVSGTAFA